MDRIDSQTVRLTDDERMVSDFYDYLRERGQSALQATTYLHRLSEIAPVVLTPQLRELTDDEPGQLDWQGLRAGEFAVHYRSRTGDEHVVETQAQSPEDAGWKVCERVFDCFGRSQPRTLIRVERLAEPTPLQRGEQQRQQNLSELS